jgi:hypothetical protein
VALGAVIVGPWLWLLVGFAIATTRRGQLLLFGRHAAGRGSQKAPSRPDTATVDDRTQAPRRRSASNDERTLGGRPSNSG